METLMILLIGVTAALGFVALGLGLFALDAVPSYSSKEIMTLRNTAAKTSAGM